MSLFKRQQTKIDLQVDRLMQSAVDFNEKFADSIVIHRIVKNKANATLNSAVVQLDSMLKNGDVEYSWYNKLSNYKIDLTLDELAYLLNRDELDKFYALAERYRIANEECTKNKNK